MFAVQDSTVLSAVPQQPASCPARLQRTAPLRCPSAPRRPPRAVAEHARMVCTRATGGENAELAASSSVPEPLQPRDDDVLPDSLTDALEDASKATTEAFERGLERCVVEILLPEFFDPLSGPVFAEEGDQQRFWKLTRRFIDNLLAQQQPGTRVRAVYPDVGVAAMLQNQWGDAGFSFSSLNDRRPVSAEDEVVVVAAADPQGLDAVTKISSVLEPGQRLVLFNPRLASGDVGVGLSVRRMRQQFLSRFTVTYSLSPVGDVGSVFRRYPGLWQVFVSDPDSPGRFKLAAERSSRPGGEDLDLILVQALGVQEQGPAGAGAGTQQGQGGGVLAQIGVTVAGVARFMRSLTR